MEATDSNIRDQLPLDNDETCIEVDEENSVQQTFEEIDEVDGAYKAESTVFLWRITDFGRRLEKLQRGEIKELQGDVFSLTEHGFRMKAKLMLNHNNRSYLAIYLGFKRPEFTDPSAPEIYYHKRTLVLFDLSSSADDRNNVIRITEPGFGREEAQMYMKGFYGSLTFVPLNLLKDPERNYVDGDSILIKIVIEPLAALYRFVDSNEGMLLWKIDDCRNRKQNEVDEIVECQYSEYFYSSPKGYRMQVRIYLNGIDQKGTSVSIYLKFCRGEFDDDLRSEFLHRVTFVIMDQSMEKRDIVRTKDTSLGRLSVDLFGFSHFANISDIGNFQYLRNDCMIVKVTVEKFSIIAN